MIKIKGRQQPEPKSTKVEMIPLGTTFLGTIGEYQGLFLCTFKQVVYLNDPHKTWPTVGDYLPTAHFYEPVDIEVTVL